MIRFECTKTYRRVIRSPFRSAGDLTVGSVEVMAIDSSKLVPVFGVVDTGASRTLLTFDAAKQLSIRRPESLPQAQKPLRTATDQPVPYHIQRVWVMIRHPQGRHMLFRLEAGFSDQVKRNLFGRDWLQYLCLAFDEEAVHFLSD